MATKDSQPWTPTMDMDSNDNVQNAQICSNLQPANVSSQSLTAVNSRSVCPLAASVDFSSSNMYAPFLSESAACRRPSLLMLPTAIADGSVPNILVTMNSCTQPMTLDSGAEISVASLTMAKNFMPPIAIPTSVREVRTFGNSTVKLFGPVPLQLQLCGMQLTHPFYFVNLPAPLIGGYDLMRAARVVVDVDNRIVWSRCPTSSFLDDISPRPPVFVNNDSVFSGVMFVQPRIAQRVVSPRRTASSGGESLDINNSRLTFSSLPFPNQRVTDFKPVTSSLAELGTKVRPDSSFSEYFTPPTSPTFYTPPTSPVDFISQIPANLTFIGFEITGNETPIVTGGADFSAISARSPDPAVTK